MDEHTTQVAELRKEMAAHHTEVMSAIADLKAYVEKIETEANDMMSGMTDPENMLKMAGKFLGQ